MQDAFRLSSIFVFLDLLVAHLESFARHTIFSERIFFFHLENPSYVNLINILLLRLIHIRKK